MYSFSTSMASFDELSKRNSEMLSEFSTITGYEIVQTNGQRICGPPHFLASKRRSLKGAEVFIGKLPRDCMEDEIFYFASKAGQVYQIRLMVNFSGENRGYCFVRYTYFQNAHNAVDVLNNTYIRPGHRVGVALSSDNTRLEVFNVEEKLAEQIEVELRACTEGFIDMEIRKEKPGLNSLILEFDNHRNTALAKRFIRSMIGEGKWGLAAAVKWAFCPLTDTRNRRKKEKKLKKLKLEGLLQNFSVGPYPGISTDAMSVVSNKENGVPNFHSSGAASQYNIPALPTHGIPILGQNSRRNSAQLKNPMTESGFNSRASLSARPSPPQYDDDEAGAVALMPPHFDIMGTNDDYTPTWLKCDTDDLLDKSQENNTSNSELLSWYEETLNSLKPRQNNVNNPGLPKFYNDLTGSSLRNVNVPMDVLPESRPLNRTNNMIGSCSNFDQGMINKYPNNKLDLPANQNLNVKQESGLLQFNSPRSDVMLGSCNVPPLKSWAQYKEDVLSKHAVRKADKSPLNQNAGSKNMQETAGQKYDMMSKMASNGSSANYNQDGVSKYPVQKMDMLNHNVKQESQQTVDQKYTAIETNGWNLFDNDVLFRENMLLENDLQSLSLSERREGRRSLREVRDFWKRL